MGFFSKPVDKNNDGEENKWKDKYLHLLDNQELSEKAYKEDQELLCKTIIRLSIVVSGIDSTLEPHLQRIRNNLKNGIDSRQLKADLESFTGALYRLSDATPDTQRKDADTALLFDFLLQHYTSPKQQQELKQLKKNCPPLNEPQRLFSAIVEIIEDKPANKLLVDPEPAIEPKLVIELEPASESQRTIKPELVVEQKPAIASEFAVEPKPTGEAKPDREQITPFQQLIDASLVNGQLLQLLENIEIPDAFTQRAQTIKQQLASTEAEASFESVLDGVISLLIEINANNLPKQQEIDKFLVQITEQLATLGMAITGSSAAFIDASTSRDQLDQSVSEQMSDLHHRSLHATQLEPLKEVISSRIAKITQEIQEHKQKEAIQIEKYRHQLDELSEKIQAMESETSELKSKLVTANTHALRDVLTDLPNRLAYDERLKDEIARWQRYHTPLCMLVWDIDFFKKINDKFGHQAGDKVLVNVGNLFSKHIRRVDFVARFGGEEFIMLLPRTNKHSAFKVAEKLRYLIENSHLYVNNTALSITISCGITQFNKGDTHETAFARADQALYRAKEQGRNQCCME